MQLVVARLRRAWTHDADGDRAADRSAQLANDLLVRSAGRGDPVDRDDLVLGADAGAIGRALRGDGGDAENVAGRVESDADPAEAVARGALVTRYPGGRIVRETIERGGRGRHG